MDSPDGRVSCRTWPQVVAFSFLSGRLFVTGNNSDRSVEKEMVANRLTDQQDKQIKPSVVSFSFFSLVICVWLVFLIVWSMTKEKDNRRAVKRLNVSCLTIGGVVELCHGRREMTHTTDPAAVPHTGAHM